MRRRVLLLVFGTTLFAVTLLGALIIATIWAVMGAAMQTRATAIADSAVGQLEERSEKAGPLTPEALAKFVIYNRGQTVLTATVDGETVSTGSVPDDEAFTATASENGVTVKASIPKSVLRTEVTGQAAVVVIIAILALGVSMIVAWFYTKRLVKPLEDFAQQAARMSTGDARHLGRRYGVPEIDAVAEVLDYGVIGFNSLLENERRVTSEVSHQLRTPLTALSLRLEEVLAADSLDEVHAEATAALGQVERLSGVIDEVASVNRGLVGPVVRYSVDGLVDDAVSEWHPAFEAAGRDLRRLGRTGRSIEGVQGMQSQVLATLVENSLAHGGGTTTIRLRVSGSWVVIEVADEGPGVPKAIESEVFERSVSGASSTGLGLALARTLSAADGGRLEMLSARPAVFAMFLPAERTPVEPVPEPEPVTAG
ncbi:MAG TPA: HAMP domain-containing sensor histidine kinase [Candidatus Nanopelagicales bacterium]|nr:HAMP domain-containing sensor histidine kinase [Candidatus Nanopelagicales bacterium]